ncbi:metallophosphoesterase family protein [Deinococcus multiflagellatus]|uniref:Metallophosphoesterase family protein n=1 Tax=Deinococcus multiflagellatus TaxID=1656887 RepID=A0ABW1ZNC7_9DEIO|nr:metallophosphoesterase family protein [Deinococcus multiflagellatus]MBZ9715258.1 metallophosphatase family protein [Deinococcus multiflagellatus]
MRVAVISDVHGNAFALEAVLREVERSAPDLIVNLGDQAEGSADPARALARQAELAANGALEVRGNNEEKLWPGGRRGPLTRAYGEWLEAHTPPGALARVAALPLSARMGDLYACHGTPASAWESLLWVWDHAGFYRARDPRELRALVEPLGAGVVLCGHTHRAGATRVGDTLVVNAGSVSDQVDGDPRARWAQLDRVGGQWSVIFHAVPYDIEAAVAWSCAHTPFGEGEARLLRTGTMDGRGDDG